MGGCLFPSNTIILAYFYTCHKPTISFTFTKKGPTAPNYVPTQDQQAIKDSIMSKFTISGLWPLKGGTPSTILSLMEDV